MSNNLSDTTTETNMEGGGGGNTAKRMIVSNKRSFSESSAEDLNTKVGGYQSTSTSATVHSVQTQKNTTMWRNELPVNPDSTATQTATQKHRNLAWKKQKISDAIDVILRIIIVAAFAKLELINAFKREIHAEELWLYKNPRTPDIITPLELLASVVLGPFFVALGFYLYTKDKRDFHAANWAWTLTLCLNAIPTSLLKITVGRPRPDFYYRCFPDGVMVLGNTTDTSYLDFNCTGKASDINEGRKSFPSGHSSFAFASYGFIAYYIGAKLHAFSGRRQTWRLLIALVPFFLATLVAVSRTCDYHHHWQDVTVGAIIGLIAGYAAYRQYYPSVFAPNCEQPLQRWPAGCDAYERIDSDADLEDTEPDACGGDCEQRKPLLHKEQSKWY